MSQVRVGIGPLLGCVTGRLVVSAGNVGEMGMPGGHAPSLLLGLGPPALLFGVWWGSGLLGDRASPRVPFLPYNHDPMPTGRCPPEGNSKSEPRVYVCVCGGMGQRV